MELKNLKNQIRNLATLPETDAPVVSSYLTLEEGRIKDHNAFEERIRPLKGGLAKKARRDLEDALTPIGTYLAEKLLPDMKGAAVFSRAGTTPFFLPLQFRVPLPNWISVASTPNIYHLVELKDTYHRYLVILSSKESACIFEVNLGAVTQELWTRAPELRKRVGREWTKAHYQKHSKERGRQFIKEKIKILEQLMSRGGHTHLILAGPPMMTSRVRDELPKHMLAKLIDIVPASDKSPVPNVVEATIASFIEAEEKESRAVAEILSQQVYSGGLAVAGTVASFRALRRDQVDTLVLVQEYSPGQVWACDVCGFVDSEQEGPAACPECGAAEMKDLDIKEEMTRIAEQQGCSIEVVNESEDLSKLGGAGCLLRYRLPDERA